MPYYYGNYGSENRGFLGGTPPVTRNLIILNIIVFIATLINQEFMTAEFALFYPTSRYFHWWQVLTHMFMHGGFWHILFNMYTLWLFGSVVENIIGSKKFLLFYFGAALGNNVALQNIAVIKLTPTVGASGAIYGVLIGYAMLFPASKMTLLFPPVTLSAKWMVIVADRSHRHRCGRGPLRPPRRHADRLADDILLEKTWQIVR